MPDDAQLAESLFGPLTINGVTLKNHIAMSPMSRRRIADPNLRAGGDPQPSGAANVSNEPQEVV